MRVSGVDEPALPPVVVFEPGRDRPPLFDVEAQTVALREGHHN
jgi:hypothetical protein